MHRYEDPRDIEMVGFIASQFAYGRVQQITRFLGEFLPRMAPSPYAFIASGDLSSLSDARYRYQGGAEIVRLFTVLRKVVERWGGIGAMVEHFYEGDLRHAVWRAHDDVIESPHDLLFFFPRNAPTSPFKRWSLYARWMVRKDDIDFGLWHFMRPADLTIPLDANIFKIGRCLGWTDRNAQSWKTACRITEELKKFCPEDPLRYDFFLCHVVGIGSHCTGSRKPECASGCLLHEI